MTANDSKSTPKKAERHPLALLADYVEAANRHLDAPSYSGVLEEAMNDAEDALLTLDPATLRAQAEAEAGLRAERDSLLSGLREAVQVWTQKRDSNRRDGDRRAGIIYGAVVQRALDILNDQETDEPALAQAGGES